MVILAMQNGHCGINPNKLRLEKFILGYVDYFMRWVEVGALTTITTRQVQVFVWKRIICRFDLLNMIFTNIRK